MLAAKRITATLLAVSILSQCALADVAGTKLWSSRPRVAAMLTPSQLQPLMPALEKNVRQIGAQLSIGLGKSPSVERVVEAVSSLGTTVQQVALPKSGKVQGVVIHVLDVHKNGEAQQNISSLLQSLFTAGGLSTVALEGAFGPIILEPYHALPVAVRTSVANYLISKNEISGPVHAALLSTSAIPAFVGVDDRSAYRENLDAYLASTSEKDAVSARLLTKGLALRQQKDQVLNPDLRAFDALAAGYSAGDISLGRFVEGMAAFDTPSRPMPDVLKNFGVALAAERAVDLPKVEAQRNAFVAALTARMTKEELSGLLDFGMAFRTGRLSHAQFYDRLAAVGKRHDIGTASYPEFSNYLRYIALAGKIDPESLSANLLGFQSRIYETLTRTDAERALVDAGLRLAFERKLIDFSLTSEEWDAYQRLSDKSHAPEEASLTSFKKFYASARLRDERMAENFLTGLHGNAIIVTGGFHSSGLESALNARGFAVVAVVPKLTHVDTPDGAKYLTAFAREKTPLENLLQGDKLFLADMPNRAMTTGLAPVLVAATGAEVGGALETAQATPAQLEPGQFSGSRIGLRRIAGGIQVMIGRGYRFVAVRVQYGKNLVIDTVASTPLRDSYLRRALYVVLAVLGAETILMALDQTDVLTMRAVFHVVAMQVIAMATAVLVFFVPNRFEALGLKEARDLLLAPETSLRRKRELISMIKKSGMPGNLQILIAALEQHQRDALTLELVKAIDYLRTNGVLREKKIHQDSLFGAIWRAVDEVGLDRDLFEMSAADDIVALNLKVPVKVHVGGLSVLVDAIRANVSQTGFRSGKEFRVISEVDGQGRMTSIRLKVIITPATLTDLWRSLGTLDFKTDAEDLYRPFTQAELVSKLRERADIFSRGLTPGSEDGERFRKYVYGDPSEDKPGLLEIVEHPDAAVQVRGKTIFNRNRDDILVESSEKIDRQSRIRKRKDYTISLNALLRLAQGNPYFSHFIPEEGIQRWVYLARAAGSVFTTAYLKGLMINRREQDHMFFLSEDTVGQDFWSMMHDELARNAGGIIISDDNGWDTEEESHSSVENFTALQLHMLRFLRTAYYKDMPISFDGINGFVRFRKNEIETDEAGVRHEKIYVYDRQGAGAKIVAVIRRRQEEFKTPEIVGAVKIVGPAAVPIEAEKFPEVAGAIGYSFDGVRNIPYVVNSIFNQIKNAELLSGLNFKDKNGNPIEPGLSIIDEFGVGSYGFLFKFVAETKTRQDREEMGESVIKARLEAALGPGSWEWLSIDQKTKDLEAIERWRRADEEIKRITRTDQSVNVNLFLGRSTVHGDNPMPGFPTMRRSDFVRDYGYTEAKGGGLIRGGTMEAERAPHPVRVDPDRSSQQPLYGAVPVIFETPEVRLGAYLKDLLLYNGVVDYHRGEYQRLGITALEKVAQDPNAPPTARRAATRALDRGARARAASESPKAGIIPAVRDRFQGWFNRTLGRWSFPLIGAPLIEEIFGSRSADARLTSYLVPVGYSMVPFLAGLALAFTGFDPILKHLIFWGVLLVYGVMFVLKHPVGSRVAPIQIKVVSGLVTAAAFLVFGFSPIALVISLGAAIVVHMGRNVPASRFDPAPLGDALVQAVAARAGGADWGTIFGVVDTLDLDRTLTDRNAAGPLSLRESKILAAYVARRIAEEELSGRISSQEAQRITERLSVIIGVEVTVTDMDFVLVVRADDYEQVKALMKKYAAQGRRVRLIVDKSERAVFENLGADLRDYEGLFDADRRAVNLAVLETALGTFSRAELQNSLLVASNQVSLAQAGYKIAPGSALSQIQYKALEEILTLLSDRTRVMPVSTLIEIARVVSTNA